MVAVVGGVVGSLSLLPGVFSDDLVRLFAITFGGYAVVLFVLTTLDGDVQKRVKDTQRDPNNPSLFGGLRELGWFSPAWGGVRLGVLRIILFIEVWIVMLAHGVPSYGAILGIAPFAISILLTFRASDPKKV